MKHYLLSLILFLLCLTASARNITYTYQGQTLTYTILDEEAKTCKLKDGSNSWPFLPGNSLTGEVVIPSEITNGQDIYTVTEIGDRAFRDCSGLTAITIPNSITTIGNRAFYSCSSLTSITIPNSVTTIIADAFEDCKGLTSVNIHDITVWCNIKFENYASNPLHYAHNLYLNGEQVTELVIPDDVATISENAFNGCNYLTSVTISNSVTAIGNYAFAGCSGLTSVNIQDITAWCNIKFGSYSANPLYYAHSLYLNGEQVTKLVIPEGVTTINASAFRDCSSLISITIPNSVTAIEWSAFRNCI